MRISLLRDVSSETFLHFVTGDAEPARPATRRPALPCGVRSPRLGGGARPRGLPGSHAARARPLAPSPHQVLASVVAGRGGFWSPAGLPEPGVVGSSPIVRFVPHNRGQGCYPVRGTSRNALDIPCSRRCGAGLPERAGRGRARDGLEGSSLGTRRALVPRATEAVPSARALRRRPAAPAPRSTRRPPRASSCARGGRTPAAPPLRSPGRRPTPRARTPAAPGRRKTRAPRARRSD